MMIGSVGAFNATSFAAATSLSRSSASTDTSSLQSTTQTTSAEDTFKAYMKMTPAERMEDAWLKSHSLTKEKLAAMSPADREATLNQMKDEIEQDLKLKTEQKGQKVDVLA
jgi:hypothetical protein